MTPTNRAIVAALAVAVVGVVALKHGERTTPTASVSATEAPATRALPRLLDLGAGKCVQCKMMKPVLDELRTNHAEQFRTEFIDVWEAPEQVDVYRVKTIPTQIFFAPDGRELFRHEGFYSEEDILDKWRELGGACTVDERGPKGPSSLLSQAFTALAHAVDGSAGIALAAALVWGVLSILLSPCHLASIPLIVGFIGQQGRMSTRRAFAISLLFAVGILITIGAIGAVTAAAGRMMGDVGRYGNYVVAVIFFGVGLYLLEAIRLPLPDAARPGIRRKGLLAALALGLVFGVALGPCTFAYMAPMLAVTFRLATTDLPYGVLLLLFYGVGHCAVIVLAGTFTEVVQRYLNWTEKSQGAVMLKKVCGLLVLLGGLYLVYTAN